MRIKRLQDELRLRNEQLDKLSRIDGLTGLANRRHIDEQLQQTVSTALRRDQQVAVLMVDIDHFKRVNDTEGHPAGDQVLRIFAARLRSVCRDGDVPGRWGGEEFIVIAPQTDVSGAMALAARIRCVVADTPIELGTSSLHITVSIGCVAGRQSGSELIELADAALYRSKTEGRNRVTSASVPVGT